MEHLLRFIMDRESQFGRKSNKNSLHSISNSMLVELNKTIKNGDKIAKK